ncbi:hypothetical protein GCM10027321_34660 [Massilia terrae]
MRYAGFSLVELMVAVAVTLLLLAAGVPSFADLIRAQRIRTATAELFDAIALTRAQAMARGEMVEIMPANAERNDWTQGWIVFIDRDGDRQPGAGDEFISVHGPLHRGVASSFGFTSPAPPYYIAYNGAGHSCSDTNTSAARLGTLSLFDGRYVRRIKINMLGRPRICDPANDSSCDGPTVPP